LLQRPGPPVVALAVLAWLAVTGVVGFALAVHDKRQARAGRPRVRERTLLLWALVGGWVGMAVAMVVVHHKTRKTALLAPFVACALANAGALWLLCRQLSCWP
jgi:uncharacterized membrane protein YsdA (DUF1294 family)